jgi:hypothetical protein
MVVEAKSRLARTGDSSKEAAGYRLAAAIKAIGQSKSEFARRSGQGVNAVINSTKGWSFPSFPSLEELYRYHRVDPAFIMFGDFGHLPVDVQDRIFEALLAAANTPDAASDSD